MHKTENLLRIKEERTKNKEGNFLHQRYVMLQWEYFFSIAVAGLLLLNYFGQLNWYTGIACVSISNVIAMLLVRIDVTINARTLADVENRNGYLISSLN
jgi:purine-cytosine permease-like protein